MENDFCTKHVGGAVDNRGTFSTLPPTASEPQGNACMWTDGEALTYKSYLTN